MARVLVPLAQGCEELEAVTIIDLLRRARIEVVTASLDDEVILASRSVRLVADTSLEQAIQQEFDMIVLPGGLPGADHLNNDPRIKQLLINMANADKYTAAICAAPKVLASAGLLAGRLATAYPGILQGMQLENVRLSDQAVVQDRRVITSRGPGTAMDFALHLIEVLCDKQRREEVERTLVRN